MTLMRQSRKRRFRSINRSGCAAVSVPVKRKRTRQFIHRGGAFPRVTANMMRHIYPWHVKKYAASSYMTCSVNKCAYYSFNVVNKDEVDPLCSSTFATAVGTETADLTDDRNVKMACRGEMTLRMKNNSGLDVKLTIYKLYSNDNINTDPTSEVLSGLDHLAGNNGWETNRTFHAEESRNFNRLNHVLKKSYICLLPGKEVTVKLNSPYFEYDPAQNDNIDTDYWAYLSRWIMVRVEGQIAHDVDSQVQVGTSAAHVDVLLDRKYKYGFITGREIRQVAVDESYGLVVNAVGANDEGDEKADDPV